MKYSGNNKTKQLEKKSDAALTKLRAREKELAVINKVQAGLAAKQDIQAIYDLVGDEIRKIFDSQVVTIVSFDHTKKTEHFNFVIEKGKRFYHNPRPLDKLRKELIKKRKTILINNVTKEIQKKYGIKIARGTETPKSSLLVPLISDSKVRGYISLQNIDRKNAFSKSDVQLLSTLAHSLSAALQSARLFDETNQRNAELAIINSVGEAMSEKLDVKTVTKIVGDKVKEIFKAEATEILLLDSKSNMIEVPYSFFKGYQKVEPFALGEGMTSKIISSRKYFLAGTSNEQNLFGAIFDEAMGEADETESYMGVPIIVGEKILGVVSVQSYKQNAFNESNVKLLSTLSANMGVVIENARLFDNTVTLLTETQQRNAELAVINKVQEGLVAKMDIQEIYDLVGDEIREIFDAQVVSIGSYDYENKLCLFKYDIEKGKRFYEEPRKFTHIDNYLIENQKIILVNENMIQSLESLGEKPNPVPGTEMPKSAIWVPLVVGKVVRGHVSLQNIDKENAFSDSDVRLLTTLANSMSVALENARLFDETNRLLEATKQQAAELGIINTVGEGLAQKLDYQAIIDLVGEKVREIFDAQIVTISPYNKKDNTIHHLYVFEDNKRFYFDKPQEIDPDRKEIIDTKKPLVFGTAQEIIDHSGGSVLVGEMPKSYMGVPIILKHEATGVITVQDLDREYLYKESDVRLLMTLASNMGVALENARLFEETNRLLDETKQRNAELGVINSVQEGLVAKMDMQAIYDLVGNKINEMFDAQVVGIGSFDHKNEMESFNYALEKSKRFYPEPRPLDTLRKYLIKDRKLILINESTPDIRKQFGLKTVPGTEDPKSLLFVPLSVGKKVNGYISLQNIDEENAFSDSDVRLLTTLANSMSVALENARLFDETNRLLDETKQRNAELGVINSVQEGLVAKMDMQAIYDLVGNKINEMFDAQVVGIGSFDHKNEMESFNYALEKSKRFYPEPRPLSNLRKLLIKDRKLILINDITPNIQKKYRIKTVPGTEDPKSLLFVPLIVGSSVNGYITLQNIDRENAFSESDVRLLTTLANSMSVALENARLFDETNRLLDETQQRNAELGVINTVQEGLVAKMDMQAIYDLVGNKIHEIFDSQVVMIANFNHEENTELFYFIVEKGKRFYPEPRPFDKLRKHLIETRQVILINENFDKAAAEFGMHLIGGTDAPKSLLFVPLIVASKVRGYISLQNIDRENAFSESDVRLLSTLANSMSVALENARLFNETNRLLDETQQRNAELGVINSVQEGLVAKMDMQAIYDLVGNKIHEIFDAQVVVIRTYDYEKELVNFNYVIEKEERFYGAQQQFNNFEKHLIDHRKPIIINKDFADYISAYQTKTSIEGEAPKSAVYVPMIVGEVVKGNISLQNIDRENAFSESDVRLLSTLANSMSVALENARLFNETNRLLDETQQRNAELGVINSVQEGLVAKMDIQAIYDLVGEEIREIFDAQVVSIGSYDYENKLCHFKYDIEKGKRFYSDPRKFRGLDNYLIEDQRTILINKNYAEGLKLYNEKPNPVPGTELPKSAVWVPLIVGKIVRGHVSLQNVDRENAFSESDVRLLTTLANSMSVALENARLFNETQQRNAELSILNAIQRGLVMEMNFEGIIDLVGDKLREALYFQDIGIRLYDKEKDLVSYPYEYEHGKRLFLEPMKPTVVSGYVLKNKKMLLLKKNNEEEIKKLGIKGTDTIPGTDRSKCIVAVPILLGDEARGLIIIENYEKEDAFSESEVRLLTTLANSMSVALENARLFNETVRLLEESKQRAAELATVNGISKAIAAHLELDKLINLVGEKVRELFKANIAYVALYDKEKSIINFPYGYGDDFPTIPLGIGLASQVIKTGEPLLLNKELDERTIQLGIERSGIHSSSYLGVPIPVGDEIIGVISVQSTEQENRFGEEDMRLLNTIAANVGVAINNAEAYRQLNLTVDQLNSTLKDLKSTQQQLIVSEKLASLGQLTAGIAHEIKNPLNFVNNFAEVSMEMVGELREEIDKIKDKIEADRVKDVEDILKDLEENAQRINQHGKRADSIVRSMLQHSRGKAGERQDSDINAMLEEDINLAYHGMRARDTSFNISIERDYDKNLEKVLVVPQDVSRVFLNIINNGFYETGKKKKSLNNNFSPTIKVSTVNLPDKIEVHIRDNGNGIPIEAQSKLFNPFFTTKPTGEGTGLGLSLSHDIIVKQHKGEIKFETEAGEFTEFIISLPKNGA